MTPPNAAANIQTEQIKELQRTIEDLTKSVNVLTQQMLLHNTKQEPFEVLVNKHEQALYGTGDKSRPGLVATVNDLDRTVGKTLSNIERAAWVIATAVFGGLGVAIWEALKAGLLK